MKTWYNFSYEWRCVVWMFVCVGCIIFTYQAATYAAQRRTQITQSHMDTHTNTSTNLNNSLTFYAECGSKRLKTTKVQEEYTTNYNKNEWKKKKNKNPKWNSHKIMLTRMSFAGVACCCLLLWAIGLNPMPAPASTNWKQSNPIQSNWTELNSTRLNSTQPK